MGVFMWRGERRAYEIKTIDAGFVDPDFKAVGDLGGRADEDGAVAADADVVGDGVLGPLRIRG